MTGLSDFFQRPIDYLRVSVTDRCNLRCRYCVPESGIELLSHADILSYEEIVRVVEAAVPLGITAVRLTGGEPLVRANLVHLVRLLAAVPAIEDLSLTTNGVVLAEHARALRDAGLRRVNVSLDSLRPERFRQITGVDALADVLRGINAARACGLSPVKTNTVVMRGVNDDEVVDFARRTVTDGWHVRFIELMPVGCATHLQFVPASEMRERLSELGPLEDTEQLRGSGPARYFRLPGAEGTIGFISPVSEHFCFGCNRLRLTADGRLRPCLLSDDDIDLRAQLRRGATNRELQDLIVRAVEAKPERHRLHEGISARGRGMAQIGG